MTKPAYILTSNGPLTIYFGTVSKVVDRTSRIFMRVVEMLNPKHPATSEEILAFIDPVYAIKRHACGLFDVCNGGIYIDGERCPDIFSKRALELVDLKLDAAPLVALWKNIKKNPCQEAVRDLYTFLDKNNHPITSDGCFIAYRAVTTDFKDKHTKQFDNKPGSICKMERSYCNSDRNVTCASGLHVAALTYARGFGSYDEPIVVVKVNPANVVSVPVDYNQQKMRVCEFEVLEVLENKSEPIVKPVYDSGKDTQKEARTHYVQQSTPVVVMTPGGMAKALGGRITDNNHQKQRRDANGRFIRS
jgi:hypothetical protein